MSKYNYDTMKKEDWQDVAKSFKIKFTDENVIRYLVEKTAEKIGIDDKISDTRKLKRLVCEKLNESGKKVENVSVKKDSKATPTKKEAEKPTKKKASKKVATKSSKQKPKSKSKKSSKKEEPKLSTEELEQKKLDHIRKEAVRLDVNFGMGQTYGDVEQIIKLHCKNNDASYTPYGADKPVSPKDKDSKPSASLDELRKECDSLGVAYGAQHDAANLQQLIDAVRAAGVTPTNPTPNEGHVNPTVQKPNEHKGRPVVEEQPPMLGANIKSNNLIKDHGVPTKDKIVAPKRMAGDPTEVEKKSLIVYRDSILNAINGHFRPMSLSEVREIFMRANYPFTHEIKANPKNSLEICITLTSKGNKLRIPSEKKDTWITIGG